jgi:MoaA/NifB/PqqE/SkfB family radical SAM enzyme
MRYDPEIAYRGTTPRYDAVLLSITERCHVGCRHCGFLGAKRNREASIDEIVDWTKQICEYGVDRFIMTGGEPFERVDAVEAAVRAAGAYQTIIGIFTSSFWGTSYDEALSQLKRLDGLGHLFLSTDVYHQERVPFDYVRNVIEAAIALQIPHITMCVTYGNEIELAKIRAEYSRWGDRIKFHEDRVIPTQFLSKRVLAQQAAGIALSSANYGRTCFLQTPIINPNGDLLACHSGKAAAHRDMSESPYYLGNLRSHTFSEIARGASRRWDYQYLRTQGPKGVAELVELAPEILLETGRTEFTTACDMCFSVLRTKMGKHALREHSQTPAVKANINVRLALGLGEDPLV